MCYKFLFISLQKKWFFFSFSFYYIEMKMAIKKKNVGSAT